MKVHHIIANHKIPQYFGIVDISFTKVSVILHGEDYIETRHQNML